MTDARTVLPGDEVAVEEEYLAGEGTYNRDGAICAAVVGELELDNDDMIAKVVAVNPMAELKEGDIVFGVIDAVRASMAVCSVVAMDGRDRGVSGDTYGTIHISKVSPDYVQDMGREVRPSDIVRAKVIQTKPSLQLTTVDRHLGVVKALCRRCRMPMVPSNKGLYCEECKRTETRKVADDYGCVKV